MTAPSSSPGRWRTLAGRLPGAAGARPLGVGLLPLALLGILSPWQVALLCAVFALGARKPEWAQGRLLLTLPVVGLGFLSAAPGVAQGGAPAAVALGLSFFVGLLAVGALHMAALWLEDGRRRGLLLALGVGLLAPTPLLPLALLGGALARSAPDDRPAAFRTPGGPGVWAWPALAALGLGLLLLTLPTPAPLLTRLQQGVRAVTQPAAPSPQDQGEARPAGPPANPAAQSPSAPASPQTVYRVQVPEYLVSLQLGALLLLLGVVLWRFRARQREQKNTLVDRLLAVGLIVLVVSAFGAAAYLQANRPPGTGADGAGPGQTQQAGDSSAVGVQERTKRVVDVSRLPTLASWVTLAATLALLVLALRASREKNPVMAEPEGADSTAPSPTDDPALHRIRRAWREAEGALMAAGLGRAGHETPSLYAARLGADRPDLAPDLRVLAAAYAPLRYGPPPPPPPPRAPPDPPTALARLRAALAAKDQP